MKHLKTYELFGDFFKRKKEEKRPYQARPNQYGSVKVGDWVIINENDRVNLKNETMKVTGIRVDNYGKGWPLLDCFFPKENINLTVNYEDVVKVLTPKEAEEFEIGLEGDKFNL